MNRIPEMPTLDRIYNDEAHPMHDEAVALVLAHLVNDVLAVDSQGDLRVTLDGFKRSDELVLSAGVNAYDVDAMRKARRSVRRRLPA